MAELIRDRPPPNESETAMEAAFKGGNIPAAIGVAATLLVGIIWWDRLFPNLDAVQRSVILFCGALVAGLCAMVYGAAFGMHTVRGRHRLRVIAAAGY